MIKSYRPTSAGMRFRKTLVREVHKGKPEKSLLVPIRGAAGRSGGRISSRHQERGHKRMYRMVDFKRDKINIPAKVASIEYDPNRGPNVALLHYADGEKRYILAPEGLKVGDRVMSGTKCEPAVGNCMPLENIPLSMLVHNIELNPGKGGQFVRGAGGSAEILAKEGRYANIKLPSGEVRKILLSCYATIGALSNQDLKNVVLGKAGRNRHLGRRPHIRGVAHANPTDHPHGGSYKTTGIGMPSPKSPWGWKTRGKKTRRRRGMSKYIIKQRNGR